MTWQDVFNLRPCHKANYQDQPEHAAFAQLLAAPKADASQILGKRFPVPRLVDCDQHGRGPPYRTLLPRFAAQPQLFHHCNHPTSVVLSLKPPNLSCFVTETTQPQLKTPNLSRVVTETTQPQLFCH